MAMIQTSNLTKYYDQQLAVDQLNISIEQGIFYGLLGPNGAGKTTSLKMLSTLLKPTDGSIKINEMEFHRSNRELKSMIGVVPQHFSLQKEMTLRQTLKLHGMLHKMRPSVIKDRIQELTAFAKLDDQLDKYIEHLSGGNKRKLMIVRSMMHEPKLLFLDEPTVGLDPAIRRDIWDLLRQLKTHGLTIVMTTHYIEEAEQLCDMIGMMSQGKLIEEATPKAFMKRIKPYVLEAFDGNKTAYHYFDSREAAADYSKSLEGDLSIRRTNLEDVYVTYTNERVSL